MTFLKTKVSSGIIDSVEKNEDGTLTIKKDDYSITVENKTNSSNGNNSGGNTEIQVPEITVNEIKVVSDSLETDTALKEASTYLGNTLYITFEHSITNGITTVEPSIPYAITANGTYNFIVTGTVNGKDVKRTVTIKANQAPYNYVTRTQAVSLAENFVTKQGYEAKTKLVSSYAWDTTIDFLKKVNSDYGSNSEEGNYKDTTFSYTDITGASQIKEKSSDVLVPTGQTTPVCNIYDMGGNVWEWSTESFSISSHPYPKRGGCYDNSVSACSCWL